MRTLHADEFERVIGGAMAHAASGGKLRIRWSGSVGLRLVDVAPSVDAIDAMEAAAAQWPEPRPFR